VPSSVASGLALVADDRILVLRRAPHTEHPGTWGIPAGGLHPGEGALEAARRETREETGSCPPHSIVGRWSRGEFTVYACEVDAYPVSLNDEHTAAVWADKTWLAENRAELHPGMEPLLAALSARYGWMKISW